MSLPVRIRQDFSPAASPTQSTGCSLPTHLAHLMTPLGVQSRHSMVHTLLRARRRHYGTGFTQPPRRRNYGHPLYTSCMSSGVSVDEFQALEQKVLRAVEIVKREREARAAAEAEATSLREQLAAQQHAAQSQIAEALAKAEVAQSQVATVQGQAEEAQNKVQAAQNQAVAAQRERETAESQVATLNRERDAVRQRVERMLQQMDELL